MEVTLPAEASSALQQYFGFDQFRPGQRDVIAHLLAGRSAAAVFPTGGGKSLCYQLPALLLDGLTIVVSPLIALMKDQIDALAARGIVARRLDSSLDLEGYRQVMSEIRNGELRLLYVAPERFNNERFRHAISERRIALFAIDEAHCISEWGHNFRPDYLKLVQFAKTIKAERVLALTATATRAVLDDICRVFEIDSDSTVNTGFYRSNLALYATAVSEAERDGYLLEQIAARPVGSAIVYVTLQKTAERVAQLLGESGHATQHYHAGMKDDARSAVQEWFIKSDNAIVVATIAFGMGIDKSDIRYVYHYNLPKSLENYSQEIGRAGRDGEESICHLFACAEDVIPLQNFIYGDTPAPRAIEAFVDTVFSQPDDFDISLFELSRQCDIRPLVLRTLLTGLELQGYLTGGTPFYADYQFKPLQSSAEILQQFEGERRDFLAALFRQASLSRIWFKIDLERAAEAMQQPRKRLVDALDYLGERGLLEVKVSGVRNRYRIERRPPSNQAFARELVDAALLRERRELQRLQEVFDWIALDGCQSSALSERFENPLDRPCGHCGWCRQRTAVSLPELQTAALEASLVEQARQLQRDHPDVLRSNIELARVLCGVTSPAIGRAKLGASTIFGVAEAIPFQTVLDQLKA